MPSTEAETGPDNVALRKRSVVSSFLFKYSDIHARAAEVALFRRSDKVRTYQHHLAPISGSIDSPEDSSALDAAWRELKEETSLTPASVKLWRKGRPFTFQDYSVGREWTIYPFAFLLRSYPCTHTKADGEDTSPEQTDGVVLNWEHDFHNWYDPDEVLHRLSEDGPATTVSGQKLVPRIAESLGRVYPEYELGPTSGKRLRDGLQQLQDDHASGARELAAIALGIFKDVLIGLQPSETYGGETNWEEWWRKARLAAWHIWKNGRESMGSAIASALSNALTELEGFWRDGHYHVEYVQPLMDSLIDERNAMTRDLSSAFTTYIEQDILSRRQREEGGGTTLRILTLSASSTIRQSILHLLTTTTDIHTVDLRVLESRPLYDGVGLASSIVSSYQSHPHDSEASRPKLHVTLYTDASAAIASVGTDLLLLGADRLAADGAVSNKTGSLPAVLAAKHVSPAIQVLVLSELDKVAGQDGAQSGESNAPAEVMRGWREAAAAARSLKGLEMVDAPGGRTAAATITIEVKNDYFEWVPPHLVDAYITDKGVKTVVDIRRRSEWVGGQIDRFFDDL